MAKYKWNVTRQKAGTEIYVSNAYKNFFIGEQDEHLLSLCSKSFEGNSTILWEYRLVKFP